MSGRLRRLPGRQRYPNGRLLAKRDKSNLPVWEPWYDDCETAYELGFVHGKEDRLSGATKRFRSGCLMTTEEYTDYRQGYGEGWQSENSPMEFGDD